MRHHVQCPGCGGYVSRSVGSCPACGYAVPAFRAGRGCLAVFLLAGVVASAITLGWVLEQGRLVAAAWLVAACVAFLAIVVVSFLALRR